MSTNPPSETRRDHDPNDQLIARLDQLETTLRRLADRMVDRQTLRKRRKQLTIRAVMIACLIAAIAFGWIGNAYRTSVQQAAAVDQLLGQAAFVAYQPRNSLLVSLLPGDPHDPPKWLSSWFSYDFFHQVYNVSMARRRGTSRDPRLTIQASGRIKELQRLRVSGQPLATSDLEPLANLPQLQSLDISRTRLDAGPLEWLRETDLRWFDASHTRISDAALANIAACPDLSDLHLERTAVTDRGLRLLESHRKLRFLNLKRSPCTAAGVRRLAKKLPNCRIEWEPLKFTSTGRVDVAAARRGRLYLGNRAVRDPRRPTTNLAPFDSTPTVAFGSPIRAVPVGNRVFAPAR